MTLLRTAIVAVSLGLVAGAAGAATQVRIDCGNLDVILQEDQAQNVANVLSVKDINGAEFATGVCKLFADYDPAKYEKATKVHISQGSLELDAEIEASKQ